MRFKYIFTSSDKVIEATTSAETMSEPCVASTESYMGRIIGAGASALVYVLAAKCYKEYEDYHNEVNILK